MDVLCSRNRRTRSVMVSSSDMHGHTVRCDHCGHVVQQSPCRGTQSFHCVCHAERMIFARCAGMEGQKMDRRDGSEIRCQRGNGPDILIVIIHARYQREPAQ